MSSIITLEEFKQYAGISSPNKDSQITPLLVPATEMIQAYLKIDFTSLDLTTIVPELKTETFITQESQAEYLLDTWDVEIVDVTLKGVGRYGQVRELVEGDWFADTTIGKITFFQELSEKYLCTVQYNTAKNPNEVLKLAACMLTDYWIQQDFRTTTSNNGQSVTHTPVRVLPKHIESILNTYRIL